MTDATSLSSRVDRALTAGGRGRDSTGELAAVTKEVYAERWSVFVAWCRDNGLRSMPATSDTLAVYAEHLVQQGYAAATAELAVVAVRWKHRVAGEPVPDGVAAWYVLRGADHTPPRPAEVKDLVARRATLAALADACDPLRPAGLRDMCMVTLVYAAGATDADLVAVDLPDVTADLGGVGVRLGGTRAVLLHDSPTHQAPLCAVCCLDDWTGYLAECGIRAGPLLRSVDKGGNIAGGGGPHGGTSTVDGRLTVRAVLRIFRRLCLRAGLPAPLARRPVHGVRVGGALDAGGSPDVIAARVGYRPHSAALYGYLLGETG